MSSAGSILLFSNNDFPETWQEETARISLKILDSLVGRARILEAVIANPRNVKESIYTPYRRIKVVEKTSNSIIFLGRVEVSDPSFNEGYGQILTIRASDYIRELFERKINSDYSASSLKRSALISQILTDYTYSGTISQNIEESGSSDTIARDYTSYDRTLIQVIEELAQEDYWTDETWGAAWRWNGATYDDDTIEANTDDAIQFSFLENTLDYFYLGQSSNPFLGAEFELGSQGEYGVQDWEYWNGNTWSNLSIFQTYDFTADGIIRWYLPTNWAKRAFSNGDPHAAAPPDATSRYWVRVRVDSVTTSALITRIKCIRGCGYDYYVDDTQTFQYFRRASKPSGGASANGLTIALNEAEAQSTRSMYYDYSICDQPKEIITRVTVRGTASDGSNQSYTATRTDLESTYQIAKEKVEYIWGSDMDAPTLLTYCTNRAKALLSLQAGIITRGDCKIVRYPYFGVGKTLVRVGDLVHIHLSTKSINEDYIVLEVSYEEPPGLSTINFVSTIYGRSYSPFELTSILQGLKTGKDLGVVLGAQIPDIPIIAGDICAIEFVIDGGGSAITTGEKGHVTIPFSCAVFEGRLLADQIGSIQVDIWRSIYESFPPTVADSICAGNQLKIVTDQKYKDMILSSWAPKQWQYGDTLAFNVDSCSTITRCSVILIVQKG